MATHSQPKFRFQVQWGNARIGFTEVTGLDLQVEPIVQRDSSSPEYRKTKMPGMRKFSNITLKRGSIPSDSDFYKWINTTDLNAAGRRDIVITQLNESHAAVMTWKAKNAFPVKMQASDLRAEGNEVAIDTLEISHEGLDVVN